MEKKQKEALAKALEILNKHFTEVSVTFRSGEPKEILIGSNDEDDGVGADRWKLP